MNEIICKIGEQPSKKPTWFVNEEFALLAVSMRLTTFPLYFVSASSFEAEKPRPALYNHLIEVWRFTLVLSATYFHFDDRVLEVDHYYVQQKESRQSQLKD